MFLSNLLVVALFETTQQSNFCALVSWRWVSPPNGLPTAPTSLQESGDRTRRWGIVALGFSASPLQPSAAPIFLQTIGIIITLPASQDMTPTERSDGHVPDENQRPPIEFRPFEGEKVVFRKNEEGDLLFSLKGELVVRVPIDVFPEVFQQLLQSPVRADEAPESSLTPQPTPQAHTSQSEGATEESQEEVDNQLHEFVGNPTYDAKHWELKSGKRVAEFVLATHPEEGQTEYQRIRAFDGLAVYVRDNVRKGQKDVFVEAWGPKHWKTRNEKQLTGFYAKRVKVPKRYRQQKKD